MNGLIGFLMLIVAVFSSVSLTYGWSCPTHRFIAQQAGLANAEYACIPDAARRDNYKLLVQFHYHNAAPNTHVTPDYIGKYDVKEHDYVLKDDTSSKPITIKVPAESGVLYWKIVELYKTLKSTKHPAEYDYALMTIAHLIGDLSQPLHNYPHANDPASDGKVYEDEGTWAKDNHDDFDNSFDNIMPCILGGCKLNRKIKITSEADLKQEISRIANSSISVANDCYKDGKRGMTDDEVIGQISGSIMLLKAVIKDTRRVFDE